MLWVGVLLTILAWILIVRAADDAFPWGLSEQDRLRAVQGRHELLVALAALALAAGIHLAAGAVWVAGATALAAVLGLAADLASPTNSAYFELTILPLIGICVAGLVVNQRMSWRRP